ncbi:hypothetical protein BDZ90DRAFT_231662 [Jaminaea rosea]|uniref:BTB domain-containing protein n=1 Tax=Jaminaea rosea TaxID=1569628 RepID=A0A316URF0_9BASI|nr:hypothetical protein BDZ90DRAFT_231662 [Jaminaea rosea]PWN27889.1 hypothetical protein BDZ90DRAFT_231662 [Jaminaea rosea]
MAQATAQLTAAAAQRRTARRDGNGKEPSSAVPTSTGYVYDPEKPSTWIPNESPCTIFEWPLTGLKEVFDTSKQETKSKVLKSVPFGGGRWSILFYAQSGHDQYCSLYLNAEPLESERTTSLQGRGTPYAEGGPPRAAWSGGQSEPSWAREGKYRFNFTIQRPDKSHVLGQKDAQDHSFSSKTSNWGWAQFAKRDVVFYDDPKVKETDCFLITVSIQGSPEKAVTEQPTGMVVPPALLSAMGSLLDDPEHSDVVFVLDQPRRRDSTSRAPPRQIYAIKKILASRSQYFRSMFSGGFAEAELSEGHTSAESLAGPSHDGDDAPRAAKSSARRASTSSRKSSSSSSSHSHSHSSAAASEEDSFDAYERILEDSDAEIDEMEAMEMEEDNDDDGAGEESDGYESASAPSNNNSRTDLTALKKATSSSRTAKASAARKSGSSSKSNATTTSRRRSIRGVAQGKDTTTTSSSTARAAQHPYDNRRRRRVVIPDSSYATFKALLYFLYTDTIEFAPLTSSFLDSASTTSSKRGGMTASTSTTSPSGFAKHTSSGVDSAPFNDFASEVLQAYKARQAIITSYVSSHPTRPAPCSAKAIYRLADKLDLPDLRARAQAHIASQLTVGNVVWEAFSSFASRHTAIRDVQLAFLYSKWGEVKKTKAMRCLLMRSGSGAHPGLPEVWPQLLSQLEYRQPSDEGEGHEGEGQEGKQVGET